MTGNAAFDVVIGIVFVYLLYSLFATIIMELISSLLGLRAKNLRFTLKRMLKNEKKYSNKFVKSLANIATTFSRSIGLAFNLENDKIYERFMNQPNIKNLGSGGFGGKPSYITPEDFSKGVLDSIKLKDSDFSLMASFEAGLEIIEPNETETKDHIKSLMIDANNDPIKFRILIEQWYERTMERSSGWFKQTTQIILVFIGAYIVLAFNVDTMAIINKLSNDDSARKALVDMAIEFHKNNVALGREKKGVESSGSSDLIEAEAVKKRLEEDINKSQSILSNNWHIPTKLICITDTANLKKEDSIVMIVDKIRFLVLHKSIDTTLIREIFPCTIKNRMEINPWQYKIKYAMDSKHISGYILTILALSLGAPFWFDLLNKLIKLRTSSTSNDGSNGNTTLRSHKKDSDREILNRVG